MYLKIASIPCYKRHIVIVPYQFLPEISHRGSVYSCDAKLLSISALKSSYIELDQLFNARGCFI